MHNSEKDPLSLPVVSPVLGDNNLLVAATVAAVVLAGSAIVYRHAANASSKDHSRNALLLKASSSSETRLEVLQNGECAVDAEVVGLPTSSTSTAASTFGQQVDIPAGSSSSQTKSSRSKDRRRRGKDPLKEVLKSGKKPKAILPPVSLSSPAPPTAATLSSSLISTVFEEELSVSADPSSSFQFPDPSPSAQPHTMIQPQVPSSQFSPGKRRQRAKSSTTASPTTEIDPTTLGVFGHSKTSSEASQTSHFILEGQDDDNVSITPSYKQSSHKSYPSQSSVAQSSHSPSSPPSSLADASELDPASGGWKTSVSKSRSKNRARLADVVFEDGLGTNVWENDDKRETETTSRRKGKARREEQGHIPTDSISDPMPIIIDSQRAIQPAEPLDTTMPPPPPSLDADIMTGLPNGPMLPPPNGAAFPGRNKNMAQDMYSNFDHGQQESNPWDWDGATASQGADSRAHNHSQPDDVSNPDLGSGGVEVDQIVANPPKLQVKGTTAMNYSSFSSALLEGGGGLGKCRTVAISIAGPSISSRPGKGVTEGVEALDDSYLVSLGVEDGDKEEFTFPTLNPLPSNSNRTRSALNDPMVNSSPSKKTKKGKGSTLPPDATCSRTSSPSKSRENRYNSGNASNGDGVIAAHTQLASLKGALEAARQREEKHKEEMEKALKDIEMLKWESTNSRRSEAELQTQVRHLMDQIQSYATFFATMTPHVAPHFQQHLSAAQYLPQTPPPQTPVNEEEAQSNDKLSDPEPSPKADPSLPLPNGDDSEIATPQLEEPKKEAQEESASSLTTDTAINPSSSPSQDYCQQSPPPPQVNGMSSSSHETRYPMSPPPSAAVPSPFFPYAMPPYIHVHHAHLPLQPFPWMPLPYQRPPAQALPPSPHQPHYPNIYPPTMHHPMSPVSSPLSPPSVNQMSPHLLHQHQPFGYGNGSAGTSSAGSYSPDLNASPRLGMNGKHRPRMKKKKSNFMNGNAKMGWEDIGDGWVGLNGVASQPAPPAERNKKKGAEEVVSPDPAVEDDDAEGASSPYSELLADAILKRPSSMRPPKNAGRKEIGVVILDEQKPHQGVAEEVEQFTEFTFPSLSDFGGSYYRAASRTESSISSSLSSSPPSTTATVPDSIGDPKWEEDRASLPPVIENAEDLTLPPMDLQGRDAFLDYTVTGIKEMLVDNLNTPRNHEDEEMKAQS